MPVAKIEVRRRRSPEEIAALIDAVYQVQREALKSARGRPPDPLHRAQARAFRRAAGKSENYTSSRFCSFPAARPRRSGACIRAYSAASASSAFSPRTSSSCSPGRRSRTGASAKLLDLCWHHPALWGLLPEKSDPIPVVPSWPEFIRCCVRYRQSLDVQAPSAPRSDEPYKA